MEFLGSRFPNVELPTNFFKFLQQVLDEALLRPGRFDRVVQAQRPQRLNEILQIPADSCSVLFTRSHIVVVDVVDVVDRLDTAHPLRLTSLMPKVDWTSSKCTCA